MQEEEIDQQKLELEHERLQAEIERLKAILEKISDHGVAAEWMRVLKERDAAIERLQGLWTQASDRLRESAAEIERHKALHVRAADALDCHNLDHLQDDLITKLRKATE